MSLTKSEIKKLDLVFNAAKHINKTCPMFFPVLVTSLFAFSEIYLDFKIKTLKQKNEVTK